MKTFFIRSGIIIKSAVQYLWCPISAERADGSIYCVYYKRSDRSGRAGQIRSFNEQMSYKIKADFI